MPGGRVALAEGASDSLCEPSQRSRGPPSLGLSALRPPSGSVMLSGMRRAPLALACLASLAGCGDARYKVVDVPFCATDDPARHPDFAKHYVWLGRDGDARTVSGLYQSDGSHHVGAFSHADARMALIECAAPVDNHSIEWADQLTADNVPVICGNQRVVFNTTLESVASERATALGYKAFLRFPKVDLPCSDGALVQRSDYSFSQILNDFGESVERYHENHKALPPNFAALAADTKAPALPPDPWGTALRFEVGDAVVLTSAGPDKSFGGEDDITVITKHPTASSSIIVFPDVGHAPTGDYQALLRARGIE